MVAGRLVYLGDNSLSKDGGDVVGGICFVVFMIYIPGNVRVFLFM